MLTEEQRKLLTEFLDECWHEFEDERVLPDCTWRRCVHCKKVSPFPSANVASFEPWLKLRTFDNWPDFGALREALERKELWDDFSLLSWGKWTNDKTVRDDFAGWLIDKDRFPRLVAEFMEVEK